MMNTDTATTATRPNLKGRKCKVSFKGLEAGVIRKYLVITHERHTYTVRFWEKSDGLRYGKCCCPAGVRFVTCHHLVRAAGVDTGIQNMRRGH
jgi:hypothetical protein